MIKTDDRGLFPKWKLGLKDKNIPKIQEKSGSSSYAYRCLIELLKPPRIQFDQSLFPGQKFRQRPRQLSAAISRPNFKIISPINPQTYAQVT